jgi:ASC-1-like (ASCH) protein
MDIKEIKVQSPWFQYIKEKQKKIEGRLDKGVFKSFIKGEKIKIINNDNSSDYVIAKIKKIRKYNSFEDYLSQEGLRKTLPNINNIQEGCNIYYKFYSKEQEKEFGVIAIEIKIIK